MTDAHTSSPAATTTTTISVICPKCVTIKKSGTRSCCAAGGAWFKNCGRVGDENFAHTWVEGLRACRSFFGSVFPVEAPAQTYETAALLIVNGTRGSNGSQRNESVGSDTRFDIVTTDCGVCVELSKLITVLFVLIF